MIDPIEIMAETLHEAWRPVKMAEDVIRALDAAGWVIVPAHATPEISHAGDEQSKTYDDPVSLYETMVEAGRIRVPS